MLNEEGVRLLTRGALLVVLILVTAGFRTAVGPSRQRGRYMLAGTLGGLALGVLAAPLFSDAFGADASSISATAGLIVGWAVAWAFAKRIPRTAE